MDCIENQPGREGSPYLFPADVGDGHFIGVVRVLDRVCAKAKLTGVTPYVLRHIFASVAGDLGFSEPTIAGWFGHAARGVTHGYVHLDTALVVAADQVSAEIARLLDGEAKAGRKVAGAVLAEASVAAKMPAASPKSDAAGGRESVGHSLRQQQRFGTRAAAPPSTTASWRCMRAG